MGERFWHCRQRLVRPRPVRGHRPLSMRSHRSMGRSRASCPRRCPGAAVTTTRAHVQYVVTEYGTALLLGLSLAERARSLINIAAPQFREQLERAAYDLHLFS